MKYILGSLALAAMLTSVDGKAAAIVGQGTWESTLQARDLDGNASTVEAYYDTALNITWLADTHYTKTLGYNDPASYYTPPSYLSWKSAVQWAEGLNLAGYDGWRLPVLIDPGTVGCDPSVCGYENVDTSTSEFAHMYYVTLGNSPQSGGAGNGSSEINTGPFQQMGGLYWFGNEFLSDPRAAWYFGFQAFSGNQAAMLKSTPAVAWVVHSGDIGSPVPEPHAFALMAMGMAALAGLRAKRS
jgi:hypothetical protein